MAWYMFCTIQLVHSTFFMHRLKRAIMTPQKFCHKKIARNPYLNGAKTLDLLDLAISKRDPFFDGW